MTALVCSATGRRQEWAGTEWRSASNGNLTVEPGPGLSVDRIDETSSSLWRYASALRVPSSAVVQLGEGHTPLIASPLGDGTLVKCEHLNPTGSFKDRGTAVMIAHLRSLGVTDIIEDSSGNAGASVATYCAAAGISCTILAPAAAPAAKLAQIERTGAALATIDGTRQDVADEAERRALHGEVWASHARQPAFLEGMRTLAFEIWEQLGYRRPDHVVMPVGNGATLLGLHLGFSELSGGPLPRLHAAQAAACAPLWHEATKQPGRARTDRTVADGISVATPARLAEMVAAVHATGGSVTAIDEDAILDTWRQLNRVGLLLEPTCATAFAALSDLRAHEVIDADETTVVIATGHGLKSTLS